MKVDDKDRRLQVRHNFEACNSKALSAYDGEQAAIYARLKLSGLDRAPSQLAVFVDPATQLGHGLGRRTMPETLTWSVVGAVHALWLAARAHGVGLGWVSILEPARMREILAVPETWALVAYLCLGYPEEEHLDPELRTRRLRSGARPSWIGWYYCDDTRCWLDPLWASSRSQLTRLLPQVLVRWRVHAAFQ